VDREAGRTRDWKAGRPWVSWRRLQRDTHRIWQDRRSEGAQVEQLNASICGCARLNGILVLSVGMLRCGVCVWEQAIREDLSERTRKEKSLALSDLVCEIDMLSKMRQHPCIVGFVGASIDETNPADTIIVLEYLDGGCLQDVLAAQSKNGIPWRPPKATSYSWYAPVACSRSTLEVG